MKDKVVVDYLSPEDDGLPMRRSREYAKDKLRILEGYVYRFITAMRVKQWRALFYIDLQAGPGKNFFPRSGDIMLGSPLIALNSRFAFTHYRFVELGQRNFTALQKRVAASDRRETTKLIQGDCNVKVREIVDEIRGIDRPFIPDKWNSLNLAFLDPNGLELKWQIVEDLGNIRGMDLIINFSTSGLTRNIRQLLERGKAEIVDDYFGTVEWRRVYDEVAAKDATHIRRAMIDFYKSRLADLGYKTVEPSDSPDERVFRNQKNVQIYTLIAASKHELGIKFWRDTISGNPMQPRLL